jgi:hypothetical protein
LVLSLIILSLAILALDLACWTSGRLLTLVSPAAAAAAAPMHTAPGSSPALANVGPEGSEHVVDPALVVSPPGGVPGVAAVTAMWWQFSNCFQDERSEDSRETVALTARFFFGSRTLSDRLLLLWAAPRAKETKIQRDKLYWSVDGDTFQKV